MCKLRHLDISDFSLNDTDEDTEHYTEPIRIKYLFQTNRRLTDRYWTGFFIVIFIVSAASWHYHYNAREQNYKTNLDNSTCLDSSAEDLHNLPDNKTVVIPYSNSTIITNIPPGYTKSSNADHKKIAILILMVCGCLVVYLLVSIMRSDYVFCLQLAVFGKILLGFLIFYQFALFILSKMSSREYAIQYDYKIALLWIIPEVLLVAITATKQSSQNDYNNRSTISCRSIARCTWMMALGLAFISQMLTCGFIAIVPMLDLRNPSHIAIVGGISYTALTIFYFGSMIVACATGIALEDPDDSNNWTLFLHAFYIVGRHHFGTACYHGTLIFPRLHAAFVMNEAEFRKKSNFSLIKRFYVTQWKLHNVSPIVTAVLGENHSESIRELLRLYADNAPNVKYFQGFTEACTTFFVLRLALNILMLILLVIKRVNVNPHFPMGTWVMIFTVIYIYMRVFDTILDTVWFHVAYIDDDNVVDFSFGSSASVEEQYSDED